MKIFLNCCSKPNAHTLFKGEKAEVKPEAKTEVKAPVAKVAELKKDTVEISKAPKAEVKTEAKPEVKVEAKKEAKPELVVTAPVAPKAAEVKTELAKKPEVKKCEGANCK